ncbi:MAG: response regulator [Bryobacteraceae bacterium]|nr:response regulator [Bryobacteraceae bacterium]
MMFADSNPAASILLIEDNPGDVRLMREALAGNGTSSSLLVMEDGDQALRFLFRNPPYADAVRPDLIFLDLNLPRKDGREVLAQVKSSPELRSIPVIILTTSQAESDVRSAYDHYANCYIRKPDNLDQYLDVIRACEHFWLHVVRLPG